MNNSVATRKQNHSLISTVEGQKSHQLITKISAPSKAVGLNKLLPSRINASLLNFSNFNAYENQCQQIVFSVNQHRIEAERALLSHG